MFSLSFFHGCLLGVRLDVEVGEEREEENTKEEDEEAGVGWIIAGGEERDDSMDGEGHKLKQLHLSDVTLPPQILLNLGTHTFKVLDWKMKTSQHK